MSKRLQERTTSLLKEAQFILQAKEKNEFRYLEIRELSDDIRPEDTRRMRLFFHYWKSNNAVYSIPATKEQARKAWKKFKNENNAVQVDRFGLSHSSI